MPRPFMAWALGLALGAATVAAQQVTPLGDQFQVNSLTSGYQSDASAAFLPAGDFLVVWTHFPDSKGDRLLRYQRYSSDGTAVGSEQGLDPDGNGIRRFPNLALDPAGGFVVVWTDQNGDLPGRSIRGRRFDDRVQPEGEIFTISSGAADEISRQPEVRFDSQGEFVVVWSSWLTGGEGIDYDIRLRRFASDGSPIGDELQVNTVTSDFQTSPSIGFQSDDGFVVTWASTGSLGDDTSGYSVQMRRFDGDDLPLGAEIQINTYTTVDQRDPSLAVLPDDSFVVAWRDYEIGGSSFGIRARRFDPLGTAIGDEFQANTYTSGSQRNPVVQANDVGEIVVAWSGSEGYSWRIGGRVYDANGTPLQDEFRVDTYPQGEYLLPPSVAVDERSRFVVVWGGHGSPGDDTSYSSIQARLFELPTLFTDGFESGDLSAWSNDQP